jgi:hypothetical protein
MSSFFSKLVSGPPIIRESDTFEVANAKLLEILDVETKKKGSLYTPFLYQWMQKLMEIHFALNHDMSEEEIRSLIKDLDRLQALIAQHNEPLYTSLFHYSFLLRMEVKKVFTAQRKEISKLKASLPQPPTVGQTIAMQLEERLRKLKRGGSKTRKRRRRSNISRRNNRRLSVRH